MWPQRQRRFVIAAVAAALACLRLFAAAPAADSLSELRSAVRAPPSSADDPATDPEKPSQKDGDEPLLGGLFANDDEEHDEQRANFGAAIVSGAVIMAAAPFWAPMKLVEDDYDARGEFASYPYQHGDGSMVIELPNGRMPDDGGTGPWLARLGAEYGTNFSGTEWIGGRVLLDTTWRFGLDAEFRRLEEERALGGDVDALWLGDTNAVFRFAQNERFQLRSGLGVNFMDDAGGSDYGFNFTYGGDWTPAAPLVFSSSVDWGTLGSATLLHLRTTAGLNWQHAETFVGYDYLRIGHYDLNGLVAGLRLWF